MISAMKKIDRWLNLMLEWIVIAMLVLMVIVVSAQLVFRWAHASLPWSEELSQYTMVWCAFISGALCVRKGSMVGLDIINMILPKNVSKVISVLALLIQIVMLTLLATFGYRLSASLWNNTTPMLKWSMGLMYAAIPFGFTLMTLDSVFYLCEKLLKGWSEAA